MQSNTLETNKIKEYIKKFLSQENHKKLVIILGFT